MHRMTWFKMLDQLEWLVPDVYRARQIALTGHGDAMYGETFPYIYHLDTVASVAFDYCRKADNGTKPADFSFFRQGVVAMLQVAYLHDYLEDTDDAKEWRANRDSPMDTFNPLLDKVPHHVLHCIIALTDEDGVNRAERKLKTWCKIRSSRLATIVKLCDRIANTSCNRDSRFFNMYQKEFPLFEAALYNPTETPQVLALWDELRKITYPDAKDS